MNTSRPYSMTVRAERAAATRRRILDAVQDLFDAQATEFTLEQVAAAADTSVQTVLRAFGSKTALVVAAIGTSRAEAPTRDERPRSVREAVGQVFDDYELIGDRVLLVLAEEHRIPEFAAGAAEGRDRHRAWVEAAFSERLAAHPARTRRQIIVALVAATDVYVWKLLRRDLGLDRAAAQAVVERLVRGALTDEKGA
jgi:AcrR family transcriptional regulator